VPAPELYGTGFNFHDIPAHATGTAAFTAPGPGRLIMPQLMGVAGDDRFWIIEKLSVGGVEQLMTAIPLAIFRQIVSDPYGSGLVLQMFKQGDVLEITMLNRWRHARTISLLLHCEVLRG